MKSLIRRTFARTWFLFILVFAGLAFQFYSATNVGAAKAAVVTPRDDNAVGEDLFAGLKWRNYGPVHGGGISADWGCAG